MKLRNFALESDYSICLRPLPLIFACRAYAFWIEWWLGYSRQVQDMVHIYSASYHSSGPLSENVKINFFFLMPLNDDILRKVYLILFLFILSVEEWRIIWKYRQFFRSIKNEYKLFRIFYLIYTHHCTFIFIGECLKC